MELYDKKHPYDLAVWNKLLGKLYPQEFEILSMKP